MLKYLILTLALCAVAYADDEWKPKTGEDIKQIRIECLKEHPLNGDQISQLKQLIFPDEPDVRQYLLCSAQKLDIFCTHEGYHADRLAKQFKMDLTEEEALEIAQGCIDKNEEGSPADVWAFRGHKCLMASKIGDKVKAFVKAKHDAAEAAKASA
ncbi:general odorant-binding protein 99a-like [Drosophila guanche]|uniref:Blast:General odorant-binding protein 99a n=1 Tax=Drosophila guanche TaxID=7266 RepID=A0A3B0KGA1_DROGU|nr:general odorant-binding protein 99a-like [Drosophila guanche]SPP82668.1 blast:General odorant-binding protein 99a [Drosophila guanche]